MSFTYVIGFYEDSAVGVLLTNNFGFLSISIHRFGQHQQSTATETKNYIKNNH